MKLNPGFVLLTCVLLLSAPIALAQPSAAQAAAELRGQLTEVQAHEAELKARLLQLDEDLKPENIEKSLAGIGSTKPEELREYRRKQLSAEKASVQNQLDQLTARRVRLEAAIQKADNMAYQQSAEGTSTSLNQMGFTSFLLGSRLRVVMLVALLAVVGIVGVTSLLRRQNKL
jgi:hypothetical protein